MRQKKKTNLQAQKWMPVDCVFAKHNMSFSNKIFAIHIVSKLQPILAINTSVFHYCVVDPGIRTAAEEDDVLLHAVHQ